MYVGLETGSSSLWLEQLVFFFKIEKHGELGLKYLKLLSEISRLNFININAYKFGQPAILASKHCSLLTVSRGVSVKHGPDRGCGWENADGKCGKNKTRNADGKNKQTNKQRKEIFLSSFCRMVGPFMYRTLCQQLAQVTQGFSQFFEPCNSFY